MNINNDTLPIQMCRFTDVKTFDFPPMSNPCEPSRASSAQQGDHQQSRRFPRTFHQATQRVVALKDRNRAIYLRCWRLHFRGIAIPRSSKCLGTFWCLGNFSCNLFRIVKRRIHCLNLGSQISQNGMLHDHYESKMNHVGT